MRFGKDIDLIIKHKHIKCTFKTLLMKAKKEKVYAHLQDLFKSDSQNKEKCYFDHIFRNFGEAKTNGKR